MAQNSWVAKLSHHCFHFLQFVGCWNLDIAADGDASLLGLNVFLSMLFVPCAVVLDLPASPHVCSHDPNGETEEVQGLRREWHSLN